MTPIELELFLRDELVKLWLRDLNKFEDLGPNRSALIDDINTKLGIKLGSPYCIGGLLIRGVKPLCEFYKLKNPIKMFASTQKFWEFAVEVGNDFTHLPGANALKGDICVLKSNVDPTLGHAYGITENETTTGKVQKTIEYNTNRAGSRNGDGVYNLTRTQDGTKGKKYLGAVDVIGWILSVNLDFKISSDNQTNP